MTTAFLGCIADDFTGATDLANNLVRTGLRVIQTIGIPYGPLTEEADAVVVALKSRTIAPDEAVALSLTALEWLREQGAGQIYFKYCSTFDSTAQGNIGPVTDALMGALGTDFTIACPAFPENGRTVFKGYLFVGDELLQESGMRNHPLTPMTDSNLVRVMQAQTQHRVGLIDYRTVAKGPNEIVRRIAALKSEKVSIAIVDALSDDDLRQIGLAVGASGEALPLLTAGSGIAIGLVPAKGALSLEEATRLPDATGLHAIVSGSCSTATNRQVAHFIAQGGAAFAIDPMQLATGKDVVTEALTWAQSQLSTGSVLIYATAEPDAVRAVQSHLGVEIAGNMVEHALAAIARGLVSLGVRQLIVAGGETSGACVQALGITRMRIGPQIAPGVPWCHAPTNCAPDGALHIALKSGNFGSEGFFSTAFDVLARH